jgi:FKBP-type peptidyl-prolyl cis-trans isomerase 2
MTAPAKFGDLVNVHFACKLEDGTVYDSSFGKEPLQFTIGGNSFMPGFEMSVIGMNPGETKTARVMAVDAYDPYNKDLVKVIKRSEFPQDLLPEVGLQIQIQRNDGGKSYVTIIKVDESSVTLDGNHPLAGKDLIFDIELIDIVKAGPDAAQYFQLGVLLQDKNEFDEAITCYLKAITIDPGMFEAYYNTAVAYQEKGQLDDAIAFYKQTIELNLNHEKACLNLGISLKEKGQFEEAIKFFEKAIQIKPDYAIAYYNLGNVYVAKGQFDKAMQFYQKAIDLNPNYAEAHLNVAQLNLLFGNLEDSWKGFEWGWQVEGDISRRNFNQPPWDGSDVSGHTVLLYTDQGFGDTIQFIRYAPLIAQRGARVVIECQAELMSLIQTVEDIQQVIVQGKQLPDFDLHCHILSLPDVFKTTLETIPSKIPYIFPDTSKVKMWRDLIQTDRTSLRVGLTWSGDPGFKKGQSRSCTIEIFSRLGQLHDITYYSLQKGETSQQAYNPPQEMQLINYTDKISDFADTAALIMNLDLVISIDTSVAHLAGALGKKVWTLIPFVPDWRWMLDREDSPWYPTMRLFRQSSPGDWETVMDRVAQALKGLYNQIQR